LQTEQYQGLMRISQRVADCETGALAAVIYAYYPVHVAKLMFYGTSERKIRQKVEIFYNK